MCSGRQLSSVVQLCYGAVINMCSCVQFSLTLESCSEAGKWLRKQVKVMVMGGL